MYKIGDGKIKINWRRATRARYKKCKKCCQFRGKTIYHKRGT